jgi:hypothetical protein
LTKLIIAKNKKGKQVVDFSFPPAQKQGLKMDLDFF